MATINYDGMELEEFISNEPVTFPKGTNAVCWDGDGIKCVREILAYIPYLRYRVLTLGADDCDGQSYMACALLSNTPKPRRATNRELAKWLAEGEGELLVQRCVTNYMSYAVGEDDTECLSAQLVRKWSDAEWHEPTVDYMGITSDTSFERKYVAD